MFSVNLQMRKLLLITWKTICPCNIHVRLPQLWFYVWLQMSPILQKLSVLYNDSLDPHQVSLLSCVVAIGVPFPPHTWLYLIKLGYTEPSHFHWTLDCAILNQYHPSIDVSNTHFLLIDMRPISRISFHHNSNLMENSFCSTQIVMK